MLQPHTTSHLTHILIPTDNPNPKLATQWRKIDDPTDLVNRLQHRNQQHFAQATGTPFTTGELSSIPFDASGPVADSVLAGTYTSPDPILQLLLDELSRPNDSELPPITDLTQAVTDRLSTWKEQTSVSPFSHRYLNQYICLIRAIRLPKASLSSPSSTPENDTVSSDVPSKAEAILRLHVQLLELSIAHSHSYPRWQKVANLMLEKDFGLPRIHRLRIIHLYEADFNLLLGLFFARQLVSHIEHHSQVNSGCYGNRAGLSAHEPVLVEELQNVISCLSRTNKIDLDNDATACYDRIPPNLANLLARSNGMPQSLCTIHGTTLSKMSYHLLSALGLSTTSYQNTPTTPVYGTGQGSTYSPSAWLQIVAKLFDAHGKHAHGATYRSPDRSIQVFLHMLGFVDDTKNHVNDMVSPTALSVEALVQKMSHDSQLWADLLHATGASLELTKMYFYVSIWRFERSGRPFLDPKINTTLPVHSPDRSTTINVPNKPVSYARRTLGPFKSPGRNQAAQLKSLRDTSDTFSRLVVSCHLSHREAWIAYFTFYLPKMTYVLNTSFLPQPALESIQRKATSALLRKSGFNKHTATAVVFGPPSHGGIGFRRLYTEQSILQASMMYKHLRTPGQSGSLYKIAISWAQLASGSGTPLFEAPDVPIPTLEDPFLNSVRAGLTHLGASLRLYDPFIPPLAREGDFYLMDALDSLQVFTAPERLKINYCRLYVKVYLASDVVSPDGRSLDPPVFTGSRNNRASSPFRDYPRQSRPNRASWALWRRALRLLLLEPRSTSLHLTNPLGPWYPLTSSSSQWRAYASATQLIIRHRSGSLSLYDSSRLDRRHSWFPKTSRLTLATVPATFTPATPPTEEPYWWKLPRSSIPSSIPPVNPSLPSPPQVLPMFRSLDPSLWRLVDQYTPMIPLSDLQSLLNTSDTITLVGDGGAVPTQASYGGVAAVGSTRIFSVKGQVDGPDPRSYRAEAYAMAAIILSLTATLSFIETARPLRPSITIISNNQGLVNKVRNILSWHTIYPSAALLPEWDILSVITQSISQLPVTPSLAHIKGHQDSSVQRSSLSLPAQLNCEADDLATSALHSIISPSPVVPVFPSAPCQLDVGFSTTTRRHHTSMRRSASAPALESYMCERNSWSHTQYHSISWDAFNAARHSVQTPRFIPKFSHRHLPVGKHVSRQSIKFSPACPSCSSLLETDDHFLLCSGPDRLRWRQTFFTAMLSELQRLQTDNTLTAFLVSSLRKVLNSQLVLTSPSFASLALSQTSIGWLSLFRGFWSTQWSQVHQRLVHLRPHPAPAVQTRRLRDLESWLPSVARFVMRQIHSLWKIRNQARHGSTPAEREARLRATVTNELSSLYALRPHCSQRHKSLFFSSLDEHLRQPLLAIRNWIQLNSTLLHPYRAHLPPNAGT